jgi:protein-tyrosine-phosphatase
MGQTRRFVFVCSGNICRSPMAEAVARERFARAGLPARFLSMGTLGIYGRGASEYAVTVCEAHGVDLSQHTSQGLSLGILHQADAILVMEEAHREYLRARLPVGTPVRLLSDFDPEPGPRDVADPIGGTRSEYEACFERIARAVEGMLRQVQLGLL